MIIVILENTHSLAQLIATLVLLATNAMGQIKCPRFALLDSTLMRVMLTVPNARTVTFAIPDPVSKPQLSLSVPTVSSVTTLTLASLLMSVPMASTILTVAALAMVIARIVTRATIARQAPLQRSHVHPVTIVALKSRCPLSARKALTILHTTQHQVVTLIALTVL